MNPAARYTARITRFQTAADKGKRSVGSVYNWRLSRHHRQLSWSHVETRLPTRAIRP